MVGVDGVDGVVGLVGVNGMVGVDEVDGGIASENCKWIGVDGVVKVVVVAWLGGLQVKIASGWGG